jgi:peptidoglycan hydrolase-like protein with peptidoglycan-binding domain
VRKSSRTERDTAAAEVESRPGLLQRLGWSHRDAVACAIALVGAVAVLVNTLFLQAGPHPAPMVKSSIIATAAPPAKPATTGTGTALPRPRPADAAKAEPAKASPAPIPPGTITASTPPARASAAIVADIQRELSRRGFYDGVIDGKYGPRTDTAIRDFEQAAALRPSTEPNEALLRAIKNSPIRARPPAAQPKAPTRPDPIGELLAPAKQVVAVQRALSEFGYGQIKPTGIIDPETQSAIQKFERERRLPVTGQLSHRVVRELAAITGRPLE